MVLIWSWFMKSFSKASTATILLSSVISTAAFAADSYLETFDTSTPVNFTYGSEQPKAGAVVGFYTYYNDKYGSAQTPDINGNGVPDNSEIDFEWLIANPRIVNMTAYTDFDDETGKMR